MGSRSTPLCRRTVNCLPILSGVSDHVWVSHKSRYSITIPQRALSCTHRTSSTRWSTRSYGSDLSTAQVRLSSRSTFQLYWFVDHTTESAHCNAIDPTIHNRVFRHKQHMIETRAPGTPSCNPVPNSLNEILRNVDRPMRIGRIQRGLARINVRFRCLDPLGALQDLPEPVQSEIDGDAEI